MKKLADILDATPEIEAWSQRIKFGGMFSNFVETTNIRLNGINPAREFATVPLLTSRVVTGKKDPRQGDIFITSWRKG